MFVDVILYTGQTGNADRPKVYSDTSSLFYKGAPLFVFNERFDKLTSRPNFYQDTTNRQGDGHSYITLDKFFSARQSTGTMIGTLYIETDNLRQIQRVRGYWAISVQMTDKTKQEAIDTIKKRFFPNTTQEFLLAEIDTIRHNNFIEQFKFFPSPDSGDIDHGYVPHWSFYYDAKRSKNGL
ncbi:hypothetical protein [Ferruginibacter sp.]|uniref:hypothetical protein n=1 Tax=Ferruginibacter sp. TaxID=1940288 RepID=UPI002658F766|nr:hypothetical protein [Ferruginibacter sp.]